MIHNNRFSVVIFLNNVLLFGDKWLFSIPLLTSKLAKGVAAPKVIMMYVAIFNISRKSLPYSSSFLITNFLNDSESTSRYIDLSQPGLSAR